MWHLSENFSQLALSMFQLEGRLNVATSASSSMLIGKWSLLSVVGNVFHPSLGTRSGVLRLRSIALKLLLCKEWYVLLPVFSKQRFSKRRRLDSRFPLWSQWLEPHIVWWLLKSPSNRNGFGICVKSEDSSKGERSTSPYKYMEQMESFIHFR